MDLYSMSASPQPRKIIRRDEVLAKTGLKKTTLYNLIGKGEFPRQVSLGARAVGWYEDEVEEWIRQRDQSRIASDSRQCSDLRQSRPAQVQKFDPAIVSETSPRATASQQPRQQGTAKTKTNNVKSGSELEGAAGSTNIERIGTTSDGREMLWDHSTGNVLVVIGHISADWPP